MKRLPNLKSIVSMTIAIISFVSVFDTAEAQRRHKRKAQKTDSNKTYEVSVVNPAAYKYEESIFVGGILKPTDVSYTFPYGEGIVAKVHVSSGQEVRKGDLLFTITPQNNVSGFAKQKVVANKSGTILKINAVEGDLVNKSSSIALIANPKLAAIKFSFSHQDKSAFSSLTAIKAADIPEALGNIEIKMKNYNRLSEDNSQSFTGYLDVSCELSCEPLLGSYLKVALVKKAENMLALDKRAVSMRDKTVRVVSADNKVKVVTVEVKQWLESKVVISSGVSATDNVVVSSNVSGYAQLKDNDQVVIKKTDYAGKESDKAQKAK